MRAAPTLAVNTASRMETTSLPMHIRVTESFYESLSDAEAKRAFK